MAELRKYGVETKIVFPLFVAGENNFILNAIHASGDSVISKNEGAETNTTNGFVDNGRFYSLTLTATEMEAARISVTIIDQGTKAYDDQMLVIETYGHASAQHKFDLDTASVAQTGDAFARLGAPAGASVSADVAAVKAQTAEIETDTQNIQTRLPAALISGRMDSNVQAMGANTLTASALATDAVTEIQAGLSTLTAAQVNAEADQALADVGLTTTVTGRIDAAISTRLATSSYTAPLNAADTRAALGLGSANLDTQLGDIPTVSEFNARTIPAADYATASALTTVDGVADAVKLVTDKLDTAMELDGSVYRFTTNALEQAPSGGGGGGGLDAAGVRAAIGLASANLDDQLAAIDAKTTQLDFTGGLINANVKAFRDDPDGAINIDRTTRAIVLGTVDAGSSETSIVTSALDPSPAVEDQFKGRIVIFDKDTTTAALRGQATDIQGSTSDGILTVTALTTSPSSGDTFTIT
jgi:hypothetical protein